MIGAVKATGAARYLQQGKGLNGSQGSWLYIPSITLCIAQPTADTLAVPDLVFSEMKFLQKHGDQPAATPALGVSKKNRKHDHALSKEGEISAFFTSLHPVLAEQIGPSLTSTAQQDDDILPEANRRVRERSSMVDATVPTVEPPNKTSVVESGSRGLHHESTSVDTGYFDPRGDRKRRYITDEEQTWFDQPAPSSPNNIERTNDPAECFGASHMAQSHHRMSRSQSYPEHISSHQRVNHVHRAAKVQAANTANFSSSMPPFVTVCMSAAAQQVQVSDFPNHSKTRPSLPDTKNVSRNGQNILHDEDNGADANLKTSSDLGIVLQQCKNIFHDGCQGTTPHQRYRVQTGSAYFANEVEQRHDTDLYPAMQPTLAEHCVGSENLGQSSPRFVRRSIYEQRARRHQDPLRPVTEEIILHDLYSIERDSLDNNNGTGDFNRPWGELGNPMSIGLGRQSGVFGIEEDCVPEQVTPQLISENMTVTPGFWRPNRLY